MNELSLRLSRGRWASSRRLRPGETTIPVTLFNAHLPRPSLCAKPIVTGAQLQLPLYT